MISRVELVVQPVHLTGRDGKLNSLPHANVITAKHGQRLEMVAAFRSCLTHHLTLKLIGAADRRFDWVLTAMAAKCEVNGNHFFCQIWGQ